MSNRCLGLPPGACPDNRCDKTVKFTIYDMFLCQSCERTRAAASAEHTSGISSERKEACSKKHSKQPSKKSVGVKAVYSAGGNYPSDGAASQVVSSGSTSSSGGSRQTPADNRSTTDATAMGEVGNADTAFIIGSLPDLCANELLSYIGFYRNQEVERGVVAAYITFILQFERYMSRKEVINSKILVEIGVLLSVSEKT